jgi:hypothetical protein
MGFDILVLSVDQLHQHTLQTIQRASASLTEWGLHQAHQQAWPFPTSFWTVAGNQKNGSAEQCQHGCPVHNVPAHP